ncbi:MAG: hypothetical protein ACPG5W_09390 [Flavobacteriales bacterium]
MILYGFSGFGGAVIYVSNNHSTHTALWRVVAVLFTGTLVGATLTIPIHELMLAEWPNFPLNTNSRLGFAVFLGFLATYIFTILNKIMQQLEQDPSVIWKGILAFIRKNIGKNDFIAIRY